MNNKNFNLNLIENLVNTQYGDYRGYISVDGHSASDLFKLCEDYGVDMNKYFLIGFSSGESTIEGIGRGKLHCSALVLETEKYGNNFDSIKSYIDSKDGVLNAKRINFEVFYEDLGKYIKRFDLTVVTKLSKHISKLNIEEEF